MEYCSIIMTWEKEWEWERERERKREREIFLPMIEVLLQVLFLFDYQIIVWIAFPN